IIERKDAPDPLKEVKTAIEAMGATTTEAIKQLRGDMDALELKMKRPGNPGAGDRGDKANGDLAAERKAIGTFVKTGDDREMKSLIEGNDPQAGYLVLPEFSRSMTQRLFDQCVMRTIARIQPVSSDTFKEPLDKSDLGASWVAETASRPETTNPTVGMLEV